MTSILDNFPLPSFRVHQKETLEQIEEAFKHKRFVVMQGPCGSGKSPINITTCRTDKNAYIMTANKMLQDQYVADFSEYFVELKGRVNYPCALNLEGFPKLNCCNAKCKIIKKYQCDKVSECVYLRQLVNAVNSPITLFNFASALAFLNYIADFGKRALVVIDEAHLIASQLSSFVEVSFALRFLQKNDLANYIPNYPELEVDKYIPWLISIRPVVVAKLKACKEGGSVEVYENLIRKIDLFLVKYKAEPENWVISKEFEADKANVTSISFKPVFVDKLAKDYLLCHADKFLFTSATILSFSDFLFDLGIDPSEAEYIDVPSTFPKENMRFIYDPVGNLSYGNQHETIPLVIERIREILEMHKEERGIIHVPSYGLAIKIKNELKDERITFPNSSFEIGSALVQHARIPNSVLLSPSMREGLNLVDDLSRFSIIGKVPYPSLADPVVKRRMELRPSWYSWVTMLAIIQAHGRSVRSDKDYARTYMLDGNFKRLYGQTEKYLPKYFKESILWS